MVETLEAMPVKPTTTASIAGRSIHPGRDDDDDDDDDDDAGNDDKHEPGNF